VEVGETRDKIEIQLDARKLVTRGRVAAAEHQRILQPQHRPPRGQDTGLTQLHFRRAGHSSGDPEIADYVAAAKHWSRKVPGVVLRQLLRLVGEYSREPLLAAVREAAS
jgi:hypothetical protein